MSAAARLGVDVTVASDHTSVFAAAQPEALLRLDLGDPGRAAAQSAQFAQKVPVAAVIGVDDDTAVVAARIAARLGLPHAAIEACQAARDKHRQRVLLSRARVPVPDFELIRFDEDLEARARAMRYPCVLKPVNLSMSRGVIRADGPGEFLAAARRIRAIACDGDAFLAERFIGGPEVAVEGLLGDGRLQVLAIFDKPDPLDGPYFEETIYVTPSRLPLAAREAVSRCVSDAAAAIGLSRGPVHAEVRWNSDGAWLIELAARPIGGRCSGVLRFTGGRTLEEVLLMSAMAIDGAAAGAAPALEDGAHGVMMIPTPRAGVLQAIEGVAEARAVAGVHGVDITATPGQQLVPLPEGSRYLGFIYAHAAAPEDAVAALRAAHAHLCISLG